VFKYQHLLQRFWRLVKSVRDQKKFYRLILSHLKLSLDYSQVLVKFLESFMNTVEVVHVDVELLLFLPPS